MNRAEVGDISREVVAEREARRKMSAAERSRHDVAREAPLLAAIRGNDPEAAARYLVKVAIRLQDGETLRGDVLNWLGCALIEAAIRPSKAGMALGLVGPPNRPKSMEKGLRDSNIALRVHELSATQPIGRASLHSAIAQAAGEFEVSESVAEKAWKAWGEIVKRGQKSAS